MKRARYSDPGNRSQHHKVHIKVLNEIKDSPLRFGGGIEQACELYLVSRLAIDPDHPGERLYLERLASALSLPGDLVEKLEAEVSEAEPLAA